MAGKTSFPKVDLITSLSALHLERSLKEKENFKDASTSDCGDSHIVSVEVRTTLETKKSVTEDV